MALALGVVAGVAHVVLVQYALAAMQLAVDEAARAGAALDAGAPQCEEKAHRVLVGPDGIMRGQMGEAVEFECYVDTGVQPPHMVASAHHSGPAGVLPLLDVPLVVTSRSVLEVAP